MHASCRSRNSIPAGCVNYPVDLSVVGFRNSPHKKAVPVACDGRVPVRALIARDLVPARRRWCSAPQKNYLLGTSMEGR